MDLSIAGLPVCIDSADTAFFNQRFADYVRTDNRAPMMSVQTTVLDNIPEPTGDLLQRIGQVTVRRLPDGRVCHYGQNAAGEVTFAITATADYAGVDIRLLSTRAHAQFTVRDWEYMYTGSMFCNRLYTLGGGVLHSAAIAYRGIGVAFSADSGVGKSTHAALWKQYYPTDVKIINDDKPAIRFDGDGALLCGTPWSGKSALNANQQVPLHAVVFIERGNDNRIRRLDAMDSMYRLIGQIERPYYDAALDERAVDFAERLYKTVPIYALSCDISRQAVDTVLHTIFSQEAK